MNNNNLYRAWMGLLLATVLVSVCVLNAPQPVLAGSTIFHVAPSGQDAPTCGAQSAPCKTIQYAVNMAFSGDTVKVAEGVYTFSPDDDVCTGRIAGSSAVVCYIDKELTILGGYTTSSWSSANPAANPTIIDGQNSRRGVRLQRSYTSAPTASLHIEGFTVRNCLATGASSGTLHETNVFGAGLLSEHASIAVEDMVFSNNEARGGTTASAGGAGAGGAVAVNTTWGGVSVQLKDIEFVGNRAVGGDGLSRGGHGIGGALFMYGVSVTGEGLLFTNNQSIAGSTATGGGVDGGQRADGQGGAAAFHGGSTATLYLSSATGNTATGGDAPMGEAGGAFGGAFFVENSALALYDVEVSANEARGGNGRNATNMASQAWGGGVSSMNANLAMSRVWVTANRSQGGNGSIYGGAVCGGGVAAVSVTSALRQVEISNSVIADNDADHGAGQLVGGGGGGLWLLGVDVNVTHATVARNNIEQNLLGQGIIVIAGGVPAAVDINYSIISDHTGLVNTAALHTQSGTTVSLNRTLYANNTVNDNHDRNYAGPSGVYNGLSTTISTQSPVGYVSPGAPYHDYHLTKLSVARDLVSTPALMIDIDQQARNGYADAGADEYVVPIDTALRVVDVSTLLAIWEMDAQYLTASINHYHLALTCEAGAASPPQVRCGSYIDVELNQASLALTELTPYKDYTVTISVMDEYDQPIETSSSVTAFPTDHFTFIPLVLR
jgi:hypothetical protein